MRRLLPAFAALCGLIALGCGNTSPTGGQLGGGKATNSGSTADTGRGNTNTAGDNKNAANPNDKSATFQVKGPALAPSLKQGEKKNVALTLDRGPNFKDAVKLSAEAPKGLKVEFAKASVAAGDPAEAAMSVEAEKDAPVGEHVVRVTATPGAGAPTALEVKVKVEAAK